MRRVKTEKREKKGETKVMTMILIIIIIIIYSMRIRNDGHDHVTNVR